MDFIEKAKSKPIEMIRRAEVAKKAMESAMEVQEKEKSPG